jgi:hypothetical protein
MDTNKLQNELFSNKDMEDKLSSSDILNTNTNEKNRKDRERELLDAYKNQRTREVDGNTLIFQDGKWVDPLNEVDPIWGLPPGVTKEEKKYKAKRKKQNKLARKSRRNNRR